MVRKRRGKGEGSIYRRADGRWVGQFEVNGKRRYVSGKSRAEVAKRLTKAIAERDAGIIFDAEGLTVGEYLARWLYERSLNSRLQLFGQNHPETATSENNLANLLREQGLIAEALAHQERAVNAFQNTLWDNHPNTATSLHHLAAMLRMQGHRGEARPYLARALAAGEVVFGLEHPFAQRVWQDLGDLDST